ncbi:hypothetical protein AB0K60_04595 [Thermopolyspora sp. NPDC052614]|uniref:hypothetical protein n=1 Tax=Thermopolyspora sp. NPDC052614 TaxID=3155682 RepID=UPI0034314F16
MSPAQDDFSKTEILEAEPPRRRFSRPLVLAALTVAVMTAGVGVAAATTLSPSPGSPTPSATATATGSPTPSDSPSAKSGEDRRFGRGGLWGRGWPRIFGGGIHGEFVVPGEQEGQWVTVATQLGEVTAVDQDSIAVKSADGYTREYVVNGETRVNSSEGIGAVKVGHRVAVSATVSGSTATARSVLDVDLRGESRWPGRRWGDRGDRFDRRGPSEEPGKGSPGEEPSATPTPSTTSTA